MKDEFPRRRRKVLFRTLQTTFLVAIAAVSLLPPPAAAQGRGWGEVFAASEIERYHRLLQVTGQVPLYPWSIRAFSLNEVERLGFLDGAHPWEDRYAPSVSPGGKTQVSLLSPAVRSVFNSTYPYGDIGGPIWTGRGLTLEVSGGIAARRGPVSVVLAPIAFWAQNAEFPLVAHLESEEYPFADPNQPNYIDLPQRFGDRPYARIHPGQSTVRADQYGVSIGFSTANQTWGPGDGHPLLLGANAPGFPHAFLGTEHPVNVWIGRLHGRLLWARLEQSEYSTVVADSAYRFATGLVGVFTPRGVPGLEVGAARFFHMPWPDEGFSRTQLLAPIETFVKGELLDRSGNELLASIMANQLASIFFRWVLPNSGFEVFGEFASEDHRHNLRDLILQLDHATAYTIGFRKAWRIRDTGILSARGETLNARPSQLDRSRQQAPFYVHASTRQGHTHLGQALGSPAAYGGSGATIGIDYHEPVGRVSLEYRRLLRQQQRAYLETGEHDFPDVQHGLGINALLFRGRWDVTGGITGVLNANRNYGGDVGNVHGTFGARLRL